MKAANDPSSKFYRDPKIAEERRVKTYTSSTVICEVLDEHGISYNVHKPDLGEDFVTIHFDANQQDFRAARFEWLQRMSVKVSTVETEGFFASL